MPLDQPTDLVAPTPDTRLYRRLEQEGRTLYHPWRLEPGIPLRPAPFRPRELGMLLAANLVARPEVRRKQHRPLGRPSPRPVMSQVR